MKYLNLFENINPGLWIVLIEYADDPEANTQAFYDDRESAENFIIVTLNEFLDFKAERLGKQRNTDDLILTISEAEEWFDNNWNFKMSYYYARSSEKYELPENYKTAIAARKYNL